MMSSQCIVAAFESLQRARIALQVLAKSDYHDDHVSYVAHSDAPELNILQQMSDENDSDVGSAATATAGGVLGGAMAAPIAAGTLIGPFILVGPLVAVGLGSALGSVLGFLDDGSENDSNPNYRYYVEHGGAVVLCTGRDSDLRDMEALLKTVDPNSLKRFTLPDAPNES